MTLEDHNFASYISLLDWATLKRRHRQILQEIAHRAETKDCPEINANERAKTDHPRPSQGR